MGRRQKPASRIFLLRPAHFFMSKAPKKATPPTPSDTLQHKLIGLEATKDGFEGLVAALISAATQGQMRLMSSGDQQGIDSLSDPSLSSARRAMQAKRYGANTSFNLNTLLGEMVRASNAYPDIDTWVMPSTKALHAKEAQELRDHAHGLGWSFIALDWTSVSGLPRLAVLCALFPDVTAATLPDGDTKLLLDAIAADPAFATVSTAVLQELRSDDVGLRAAAKHSHFELARIYTDPVLARAIAGPSPAFLKEAPPVERPGLTQSLQNWWNGDKRVAALIGDEGMGKTWQGLGFMRSLETAANPPVVVVIKAKRAENTKNAYEAVLDALVEMFASSYTKINDPRLFWQRRLHRWARSPDKSLKLLVLIDGLDELDPFTWEDWLAPLLTSDVASLYRMILACRSDDWTNRIAVAQSYPELIETVAIAKFEPAERDAYLTARGIDIAEVSKPVLQAALHPRTAFHLTRMATNLKDLRSVTREQLLLRDFQHRYALKGGPMTGEDFRVLVQTMAKKAQDAALHQKAFAMTKGAVLDEVADITGYDKSKMRTVLSDLLSSTWCQRSPSDPTKLEFSDKSLPDAVGMALAAEIEGQDMAQAQDTLERFLEPWGADDILEPILRTCATALMIDKKVGDAICFILLDRWFRVPFHNDAGQDFWRRVHIFRPRLMLDFAEKARNRHFNWLCEWGIACLWEDHPDQRPLVEERLNQWLVHAMLPRYRKHEHAPLERHLNRDHRWQLGRAEVLKRKGMSQWHDAITSAPKTEDAYLPTQAIRTLSFLPRMPLLGLIREWALATAAAGHSDLNSNVAALTRWNKLDHDAFIVALRDCAKALPTQFGLGVGKRAAAILLRLTGLEDHAVLADQIHRPPQVKPGTMLAINGTSIDITPEGQAKSQFLLAALAPFAVDPEMQITPALRTALLPEVTKALQRPGLLYEPGDGKTTVARWFAPELRAASANQIQAPLPTGPDKVEKRELARRTALVAMPGMEEAERRVAGKNFATEVEDTGRGWPTARAYQLSVLPAAEQIAMVVGSPPEQLPEDSEYLLRVPSAATLEALAHSVDFTKSGEEAHRPMKLVWQLLQRHNIPGAQATLDWKTGFQHPERPFAVDAMSVARALDPDNAARVMRDLPWDYHTVQEPLERYMGSDLLAKLPDAEIPGVIARMHPQSLLYLYHERPSLRATLTGPILDWLKDEMLTPRSSHSVGGRFVYYNNRKNHYATFYADHAETIDAMVRQAWDDKRTRRNISFGDTDKPVWPLMRQIGDRNPALAKEVWEGSLAENRGAFMSSIEAYPAGLGDSPEAEAMRLEALRRHDTDDHLYSACIALQKKGHQATVIGEVRRNWQSAMAIEKARALTMAGFLYPSAEAQALWQELARPQAGWLLTVYDKAWGHFRDGQFAHHWAGVLSKSDDTAEVWTAYLLMLETLDSRLSVDSPVFDVPCKSWKAHWLDFLSERRGKVRAENEKAWKDTQLLTEKVNTMVYID